MRRLPVLTYNIHKGFSTGNRRFVLETMRQELHAIDADVVFLQEVLGRHDRHAERVSGWPLVPQVEYLAGERWPHALYGQNRVYGHGHHGNALISKFPILEWGNVNITAHRFEDRGVLHARLALSAKQELICACLHLSLLRRGRDQQLRRVTQLILEKAGMKAPLIVAGDFNDWSQRASGYLETHANLEEAFETLHGEHARTYPSTYPILRLDRIYYRGIILRSVKMHYGEPWSKLSDHAPLEAEFEL